MNKKTVKDIDVAGKRVLVRVDFNVPLNENKEVTDDTRIVAALPTIEYLVEQNVKVILCSHLGRPKGEFKPEFSLNPVAQRLEQLIGRKVTFATDVVGESAKAAVAAMKDGDIVLLENVRFIRKRPRTIRVSKLASFADIFVNDAFGLRTGRTRPRWAWPRIFGCGRFPDRQGAGFPRRRAGQPTRPFVAILAARRYRIRSALSTT